MEDSSDKEDVQVEEEPLTDKRQKRTLSRAPALTAKRAVRPPPPDLTWILGHYETTEGAGPAISERAWRGRYEEAEDVDDRHSWQKRKADYDLVSRQRATAGVKPNRVFVLPGGEVDATYEGKNAWDEALIPKCLDMSVVAWSKHDPQRLKKLRAALDNEFEYVGNPLSMVGFRLAVMKFLKSERFRLKNRYLKGEDSPPLHIDKDEWKRLKSYWNIDSQKTKAQCMALLDRV